MSVNYCNPSRSIKVQPTSSPSLKFFTLPNLLPLKFGHLTVPFKFNVLRSQKIDAAGYKINVLLALQARCCWLWRPFQTVQLQAWCCWLSTIKCSTHINPSSLVLLVIKSTIYTLFSALWFHGPIRIEKPQCPTELTTNDTMYTVVHGNSKWKLLFTWTVHFGWGFFNKKKSSVNRKWEHEALLGCNTVLLVYHQHPVTANKQSKLIGH